MVDIDGEGGMTHPRDGERGRAITTTPFRAIMVLGVVAVIVSSTTVALRAIGSEGMIQMCSDSGGNLKVVPALPCPKGFTALPPLYTSLGSEAAFLTRATA